MATNRTRIKCYECEKLCAPVQCYVILSYMATRLVRQNYPVKVCADCYDKLKGRM